MPSYVNTACTVTLQTVVNLSKARADIEPVLNVVQYDINLALAIANDTMNDVCGVDFPWKFNEIFTPQFVTNSFQQDYAGIYSNGSSLTNLSWLERGIVIDINNQSQPKPYRPVEVGRQLPQATGTWYNSANDCQFFCNYFPNTSLYYGTWGDANVGNSTLGNNPVAGSQYTNPVGLVNGQAISQPSNPINQIQDANGNYLVLTGYGICGSTAPVLPASSVPGTTVADGTCTWTVVDPNGQGFRILPVPSQTGTVWQFNLWGQALPIRFASLKQTLAPLTDQYETNFRQIFIARCYQYSPKAEIRAKFAQEHALAMEALKQCRVKSDREQEENRFVPERTVMGSGGGFYQNRRFGPQNPFFPS